MLDYVILRTVKTDEKCLILKLILSDKPDKVLYEICLFVRKSDKRIGKLFVKRGLTFAVSQQLYGCKIKRITNFVDG